MNSLRVEVRQSNRLDESLIDQSFKSLPRVDIVNIREQRLLLIVLWEENFTLTRCRVLVSHRPMDQVQIQVVRLQSFQTLLHGCFDRSWLVECIPEFRCNEEISTLDRAIIDLGAYSIAYFILVAIDIGTVDVTIATVDGILHSLLNFADFRLIVEERYLSLVRKSLSVNIYKFVVLCQ